jgi:hypothetical protein
MPFFCTICEEESTRICARCTKDTCSNHLCDRCGRCSDCCECEPQVREPVRAAAHPAAAPHDHPPASAPAPVVEPVPPPAPAEPAPAPVSESEPEGPAQA